MKAQFISKLVGEPWQLDGIRARTILADMLIRLRAERPAEDVDGDPLPVMQVVGDVAVIPIRGCLMLNVPDWVKGYGFGLTDINDIEAELDRALSNPAVSLIAQDIDSPGGESVAGNKLFDLMETANRKKPVLAWCADGALACSAAYNGAAASTAIYAARYATLGNVGSYLAMLDTTEYYKLLGIVWEVFRSGEYKGIGIDPLSEDQRAYLQSLVDQSGARIRKNVSKYRKEIDPADLQGQWYQGDEATGRGFAAGNAKDLSGALAKFRKLFG